MSKASRERLATIVRDPACDLAEAALLCCLEAEPDLDVEGVLRHIDALADTLRARGFEPQSQYAPRGRGATTEAATADAQALSGYLAGGLGFTGDTATPDDPRNGLLTAVLERRQGWPSSLAIVYIAVGRRLALRAFGIDTPGSLLVGVGGGAPESGSTRPAVVDPFHHGAILDDDMLAEQVRADTAEQVRADTAEQASYHRSMLRPALPAVVLRRVLNDLGSGYLGQGDAEAALWTTELKRLLPGSGPGDVLTAGQLLALLGRYRDSAHTLEDYLIEVAGDIELAASAGGPHLATMARVARRARAKMN